MLQYIIFSSNDQHFALSISKIEKIIEYDKPKYIPETASYFLGVIQYDKKILPIIDLTNRLYNVELERSEDDKIIVVIWKEKQIGLLVDDIKGIYSFEDSQIEKSGRDYQIPNEYIQGFVKTDDDIILMLDTDKLFNPAQELEIISSTEVMRAVSEI